jgi:hypothetical protein
MKESKTGRKNKQRHTKATISVNGANIDVGLTKQEIITRMEGFALPTEPFTIRQAEAKLGASHWFFTDHIKTSCKVVGESEEKKRGKKAVLYSASK